MASRPRCSTSDARKALDRLIAGARCWERFSVSMDPHVDEDANVVRAELDALDKVHQQRQGRLFP